MEFSGRVRRRVVWVMRVIREGWGSQPPEWAQNVTAALTMIVVVMWILFLISFALGISLYGGE